MTTFVALGDSITVGMGDPAPEGSGWRGWAALLGASLHQPVIHNLATLGALAVDVECTQLPTAMELKLSCSPFGCRTPGRCSVCRSRWPSRWAGGCAR
jgi:hypothetical protein